MKWDPRKKSALGDKAAMRRREVPLVWDRVPFATKQILGRDDSEEQYREVSHFTSFHADKGDRTEHQLVLRLRRSGTRRACRLNLLMIWSSASSLALPLEP